MAWQVKQNAAAITRFEVAIPYLRRRRCRSRSRPDVDLGCKRPMDGTLRRYFHQFLVLFPSERASHFDFHLDPVEHAFFRFTFLAIPCMNARMPQRHGDILERKTTLTRIQSNGHRRAGAEAGKQVIIWIRRLVAAADAHRFVGSKVMLIYNDFLFKGACVAPHHDIGFSTVGLRAHVPIMRARYQRTRRGTAR